MKTLLILEEGEKLTRSVGPAFQKAGYEVITYRDPTGVLVMARQIQPDVMVIDATLRGQGAVSALKSFSRNVHMTDVPAIALVGTSGPQKEALMAAGARVCVSDPPVPGGLVGLAEQHRLQALDFSAPAPAVPVNASAEALSAPARLQAVAETGLLDSPVDPAYDRLTRLATRLLSVPVSLASFVASDRQFFKSETGLDGKWKERRGTPLSHSFCQWVVSSRAPVIVDDARRHRVLRSNAAVDELGVVAYAGVPVVGKGGEAIGSMCAIDHVGRNWSDRDVETLQDLALILQSQVTGEPSRAANAVEAAARLLVRHGPKLAAAERADLVGIVGEQAARLAG